MGTKLGQLEALESTSTVINLSLVCAPFVLFSLVLFIVMASTPKATLEDNANLPRVKTEALKVLGRGVTGVVFAIDDRTAAKTSQLWDSAYDNNEGLRDIWIERKIYERLGAHPRICKYMGSINRGLLLERLGDSLRKRLVLMQREGRVPAFDRALKWSIQATEAIAYIHTKEVVQGDIGCYNFLLDDDENLKLCDFGGSSIDGCDLKVGYGVRSQLWRENWKYDDSPSIPSELFALGSTIHEIWTTKQPYHDLSHEEVESRYKSQNFPDLGDLPVAEPIRRCWFQKYLTANEVVRHLQELAAKNTPKTTPNCHMIETDTILPL